MTPFEVRLAMTRLAVGRHPRFAVRISRDGGPENPIPLKPCASAGRVRPGTELFFILGLDAILEIASWKDYRELFTLSHFVVLDRPGYDPAPLGELLKRRSTRASHPLPSGGGFQHPTGLPGVASGHHSPGHLRHSHPQPGAQRGDPSDISCRRMCADLYLKISYIKHR